MANLVVKPVITRRERKEFLEFPWRLYRDDPNWIPPLRGNQRELVGYRTGLPGLSKRHPFYERASSETFLAFRDGRPCGRIAAILNQAYNEWHDQQLGFFGFFEVIDDQEVANALFDAAHRWLADRGIKQLRGPVNPSISFGVTIFSVPSGWTATPPVPGPKITVQATDFTFNNPIVVYPYKVATVEYHAAVDGSIDDLAIVLHGWFNTQMLSGVFDEVIGGTVQIGSAGAEESSWGAVKGLFR